MNVSKIPYSNKKFTPLVKHIVETKEPIPDNLLNNSEITKKDIYGFTPAMYYVMYRNELPPISLKHGPDIRSNSLWHIVQLAAEYISNLTEIPEWMIPETAKNYHLGNICKSWIRHQKSNPPINIRPDKKYLKNLSLDCIWIAQTRTEPPEWMRPSPIYLNGATAITWIKYTKTEPLDWMKCAPEVTYYGHTMAITWIIFTKTEPPDYMRYPSDTIKNQTTMAIEWIRYVGTEPPDWMLHDPKLIAPNRETMVLVWIRNVKTEPPDSIRYPSDFVVSNCTMAIEWIRSVKTEPPDWMKHAPNLNTGLYTMATTWIACMKTNPPCWMQHAPEINTEMGGTAAMIWIKKTKLEVPEWMQHSPRIKDDDGLTVTDLWRKYRKTELPAWMLSCKIYVTMKIGCPHKPVEVIISPDTVVCSNCGTGEKIYCNECCPICLEDFEEGKEVNIMKDCKHTFCKYCLQEWVVNHSAKCPTCNK
jgi:hypothetical protein